VDADDGLGKKRCCRGKKKAAKSYPGGKRMAKCPTWAREQKEKKESRPKKPEKGYEV